METPPNRPFRVDPDEYPFTDQWYDAGDFLLHYLDEGRGQPVLMLHGNPTWSFLYRNIIKGLDGQWRCIAPDYPGFGFSGHPAGYGYTPAEHAYWIRVLLDELRPDPFILVVQDWGGPIGLSIAVDQPDRIAGIVLCNSWCWPPFFNAWTFSVIMGGAVGKYMHLHHNFFARAMIPAGIHKKPQAFESIKKSYTDAFPTPLSRIGTYVFPREIRKSADWLKSIENRLQLLASKPVEMVWAMKDPAFGKEYYIRKWQSYFPAASVDRVKDASHFIQEDSPDRIIAAIKRIGQKLADN